MTYHHKVLHMYRVHSPASSSGWVACRHAGGVKGRGAEVSPRQKSHKQARPAESNATSDLRLPREGAGTESLSAFDLPPGAPSVTGNGCEGVHTQPSPWKETGLLWALWPLTRPAERPKIIVTGSGKTRHNVTLCKSMCLLLPLISAHNGGSYA